MYDVVPLGSRAHRATSGRVAYPIGQTRSEAATTAFSAPAAAVTPIEGQDYKAVPTTDMTAARP